MKEFLKNNLVINLLCVGVLDIAVHTINMTIDNVTTLSYEDIQC